jgi:hypothetical protein
LSETLKSARRTVNIDKYLLNQRVITQFFAQRTPIQTEDAGRLALIAMRVVQNGLEKRPFDFANDEVVEIAGAIAIKAFEIDF